MNRLRFHTEYQVPFCRPIQCLLNGTGNNKLWLNGEYVEDVLWNCLPKECKMYLSVFLALIAVLAVMTITFNCLILGINLASRTRRMRRRNPTMSNYSTYVISIAIADLLVGIVVLPLCLANFYVEYMSKPIDELLQPIEQSRTNDGNNTLPGNFVTKSLAPKLIAANVAAPYNTASTTENPVQDYVTEVKSGGNNVIYDFLGVFTHLTLFVSMYTLIIASGDRFYAATSSVNGSRLSKRSNKEQKRPCCGRIRLSCQRSTIAVFAVWILGLVFAVVPLLMRGLFHFRHLGHVFAVMTSDRSYTAGVRWYLVTLIFPLVGMWVLNVLICFTLWRRKRQLKIRRQRSLRRSRGGSQKEGGEGGQSAPNDSVFTQVDDKNRPQSVLLYPSARWNQKDDENGNYEGTVRAYTSPRLPQGKKHCKGSLSSISKSSQRDSRSSGLRRKVSSIKRAKELLRNQSYEANITKTLCTVVFSFTIAVLPIIVVTSCTIHGKSVSIQTRNTEVTALSCSLLLLFCNSFFNCVIYGARMRDFRSGVLHFIRTFVIRAKGLLCCSCVRTYDLRYYSDSGAHLFARTKSASCEPSPRPGNEFPRNRLRYQSKSRGAVSSTKTGKDEVKVKGQDKIIPSPYVDEMRFSQSSLRYKDGTLDQQLARDPDELGFSSSDLHYVTCYSPSDASRRASQIIGTVPDVEQTIYTRRQQFESVSTISSINRRTSWRNSDIDPLKLAENNNNGRQSVEKAITDISPNSVMDEPKPCLDDGETTTKEEMQV